MPNVLGLYTKQEAKELRDIRLLQDADKLLLIAGAIRETQTGSAGQTTAIFNMRVHDDVVKYFRNTVGYTVTTTPVPGEPNHFIINTIDWS